MHRNLVYTKVLPTNDGGEIYIEILQTPGSLIPYAEDLEDTFGYRTWKQHSGKKSSETISGFGFEILADAFVSAIIQSKKWL